MTLFLIFLGVGFGLIFLELFVPGGIVGTVGALSLVAALITAYVVFGTPNAHFVLLGMLILAGGFLWWWLTIFPHSRFADRIAVRATVATTDHGLDHLVGRHGVTLTPLRPAGMADLDGERVDVVSDGDFVEADEAVVVIRVDGTRIVVQSAG